MDINALLAEIRAIVADEVNDVQTPENEDRLNTLAELAGKVADLDAALTRGHYLPTDWQGNR